MISVVVDGRNDSHGYNLHKRAAISLNSIAWMLTDESDEIVFVDYNTPDDFPTFPEAIADLLTERARRRLRILRVRPALHQRLTFLADSVLLDVIARNVGYRRTDPRSRWILSTTTDMVFAPVREGESLSDVARGLPDGFYGLSRFEVPEALWETLDRRDPAGILASLRAWGPRLHLHEAVRAVPEAVYDNCGDAQLMLRSDLFAVHGLDERMIVGWQHSDSSLQRRLALLRGGVSPLAGRLRGYHCDHTRQATGVHAAGRLENDWDLFVAPIDGPFLPFQADDWGLPGEAIEEIRLDRRPSASPSGEGRRPDVAAALEAALPAGPDEPFEGDRRHEAFDTATVPVAHVVPFLADHLATLPPAAVIAWAGIDIPLMEAMARVLRALGGGELLAAPGPLRAAGLAGPADGVGTAADAAAWQARATVLLFDFSLPLEGEPVAIGAIRPAQRAGLLAVRRLFLDAVEGEKRRLAAGGGVPRKFIAVNAVHTGFEPLVGSALDAVATPFSTRIRHGHVKGAGPGRGKPTRAELFAHLATALRRPVAAAEVSRGLGLIAILRRGEPPPALAAEAGSPVVAALLRWPRLAALAPERLERLRALAAGQRRLRHLAGVAPAPPADPGARPAPADSKICDGADWDHPAWGRWNGWYTGHDGPFPFHGRDRGLWERVHMLYALDRAGALRPGGRVAVVLAHPDPFPLRLTDLDIRVDVLSPHPLDGDPAALERDWARGPLLFDRDRLDFRFGGLAAPEHAGRSYDAILVPAGGCLAQGVWSLARHLAFAQERLADHGALLFSAPVALESPGGDPWFDWAWTIGDDFGAVLRRHSGLLPGGPFDGRLSAETLDHWAERTGPRARRAHLVLTDGERVGTTGIWSCRRRKGGRAPDEALLRFALQRSMGPLLRRLSPVGAGRRVDGAVEVAADAAPGPFLRGGGIAVPGGPCRLSMRGTGVPRVPGADAGPDAGEVLCLSIARPGSADPVALWRGRADLFRGAWTVTLTLPFAGSDSGPYDLVLIGLGGADLRVEAIDLLPVTD